MFKKRIIKLIAILALLSMIALSLAGCVFVQKNEERIAQAELVTINGAGGIKMTLTRNEILDYFNSYAYYLMNYYYYTAEQAMDFAIESKIKNKYLITVAMVELSSNYPARIGHTMGGGKVEKPSDVLTLAEYYAAAKTVNDTVDEAVKTSMKTTYQQSLASLLGKAKKVGIDRIEFTEETLDYLRDEYYLNQEIDTDKIKFVIVYEPETAGGAETFSDEFIVPDSSYSIAFDSAEKGEKELQIKFEEKVTNEETGEVSYETHYASHEYEVVEPRATKTKVEEIDDDEIAIGDIKVNRYATVAELEAAGAVVPILNVKEKYEALKNDPNADSAERDAYRQLNDTLAKGYKDIDYLYNAAFESAVVSALQAEVQKSALKDANGNDTDWDAKILEQYKYFYGNAKQKLGAVTEDDLIAEFANMVKSNLDSYYYHPEIENLNDYVYVYQILFNFSEDQAKFLTANTGSDEDIKNLFFEMMKYHVTSKESNPAYDADYDCERHEKGNTDAVCKWEEEGETGTCPSLAYILDADGNFVMHEFMDVYEELQQALIDIAGSDMSGLDDPVKQQEAFKLFEEYMYKYNDDGGIMNSPTGYFIAPKGVDDPNGFYESFVNLAHDVYAANSNVGNAFVKDENGDYTLGYAFTDYGIHIIMTSMKPFADYAGKELSFTSDAEILAYIKNTAINLNGDTIYKILKDKIIADAKTQAYNEFTARVVHPDLHNDTSVVTKNEKKIEELYKELG